VSRGEWLNPTSEEGRRREITSVLQNGSLEGDLERKKREQGLGNLLQRAFVAQSRTFELRGRPGDKKKKDDHFLKNFEKGANLNCPSKHGGKPVLGD